MTATVVAANVLHSSGASEASSSKESNVDDGLQSSWTNRHSTPQMNMTVDRPMDRRLRQLRALHTDDSDAMYRFK